MSRRAARPLDPEARREANRRFYARHPERDPARGGSGIHPTAREDAALRREWMDYYEAAGGAVETVPRRRRPADRMVAPCCDSWIHFIVMDQETERRLPEVLIFLRLPNGEERLVETNGQGEVLIENIPSGNCTIMTFDSPDLIPALEQIQNVDFSAQRVVMPAETSAQDEPPTQEEPSEESEESTESETTLSVRSLLLHQCADYHVQRGDDLETVARVGGFDTIGELLGFNFGRLDSPDAVVHALTAHVGVNEDSYDEEGNLVFSGNEEPGVFYYPIHDDSEHATEQVHIIKVQGIRRRSPLELETVDELGQHRPNQQLQLVPTCGEPIPIETDDDGY
ncbi:MAG: hypothetical protein JRI36_13490, partial [Deltaproteobacteria bacterium]|nr:hypothetical protein [Deltaproteobacteria bacterium]